MARICIHACCAHCLGKLLATLRADAADWEPLIFWGNPNIHPLMEWRRRLKAVKMLTERARLPLIADETYDLVEFTRTIHGHEEAPARCQRCYALRLNRAAEVARENRCPVLTTTLVTSRHQDHTLIRAAGETAARSAGIRFLYIDARAAEAPPDLVHMLYRQQYCGCVFSEYDRYRNTTTHLWKSGPVN